MLSNRIAVEVKLVAHPVGAGGAHRPIRSPGSDLLRLVCDRYARRALAEWRRKVRRNGWRWFAAYEQVEKNSSVKKVLL